MINPSLKIALVRGAYLNNFEGQNYDIKELKGYELQVTGFGSIKTIHQNLPFKVIRLPSFSDYNIFGKWGRAIANRTIGDIQNLFGLEKYASQFDIFHTADPHYYYSYQLAKLRHDNKIKRLIVTSWETIPHNNETVVAKKKNKYFVLHNADHFICHTDRAKKCLIEEGVEEQKISVIRLGVDLEKFQTINPKSQINSKSQIPNTIQILFVGRLVKEKGILDVYEAFKNVKRVTDNAKRLHLHIVGDGPLKHYLEKKIFEDHLEKYIFIENKSYEEMPKEYQQADIFIAPSKRTKTWEEQYGMVFLEAMASGLPIVTYDTGAIKEIVEEAGIICPENNREDLSKSLLHLIANKNERIKMCTMGRERAKKMFDCKKTAKELRELYFSI